MLNFASTQQDTIMSKHEQTGILKMLLKINKARPSLTTELKNTCKFIAFPQSSNSYTRGTVDISENNNNVKNSLNWVISFNNRMTNLKLQIYCLKLVLFIVFFTILLPFLLLVRTEGGTFLFHVEDSYGLKSIDPFEPKIVEIYKNVPRKKPLCKPKAKIRSSLVNGELEMIELADDEECNYRCILGQNNNKVVFKEWIILNDRRVRPKCDAIEVRCTASTHVTYKFLHQQIYKPPNYIHPPQPSLQRPNVHVILLDSVSMPHFLRAMPKTSNYLKNSLGASFFKYHNKAAYNSEPNAFILYMNKLVQRLASDPGGNSLPFLNAAEINACATDSTYIAKLFKDKGYKVMINEDWPVQLAKTCKLSDPRVYDHNSIPYWSYKNDKFPDSFITRTTNVTGRDFYHSNLWPKYCQERHTIMFDYIKQFAKAYPTEPKLTMSWFAVLAHDNRRDLFPYDEDFLEFFKEFSNETSNSHTFFLADHGIRIFEDQTMLNDKYEDLNPMLIYIPPEELRRNRILRKQLDENTEQMVTHYDTYATFIDILNHGPKMTEEYDFTSELPDELQQLKGSSLLRPLKQPRSCKDLNIHYEGCMQNNLRPVLDSSVEELGWKLAKATVEKMNKVIEHGWAKNHCVRLSVWKEFKPLVEEYKPGVYRNRIYQVTFKTYPGGGLYMPYLQVSSDQTITVLSTWVTRKNAFRSQTQCVFDANGYRISPIEDYCFCKNLLRK